MGSRGPDLSAGLLGGNPFDANGYPPWLAGSVPRTTPPNLYRNDPWSELAAWVGLHPDDLTRLYAAIASSPGFGNQNGASESDQRATGYDQRGAVDVTRQFAPRNAGREWMPDLLPTDVLGRDPAGVQTLNESDAAAGRTPAMFNSWPAPDNGTFNPAGLLLIASRNQRQNAMVRAVQVELGLTNDQRQWLHDRISGENYPYKEILRIAREEFGDRPSGGRWSGRRGGGRGGGPGFGGGGPGGGPLGGGGPGPLMPPWW
jgi:hypothetical protein